MNRVSFRKADPLLEGGPFEDARSVALDGEHIGYIVRDGDLWRAFDQVGDALGAVIPSRRLAVERIVIAHVGQSERGSK